MTTPERLRRRQLIEGFVLLLLAIFTVAQSLYFSVQNNNQQQCFERKFTEFSAVSKIRAGLATEETAATRRVLMVYAQAAGLVKDKEDQKLTPAQQKRFTAKLVDALVHYARATQRIQEQRREHPVPPYPVGACSKD